MKTVILYINNTRKSISITNTNNSLFFTINELIPSNQWKQISGIFSVPFDSFRIRCNQNVFNGIINDDEPYTDKVAHRIEVGYMKTLNDLQNQMFQDPAYCMCLTLETF